MALDNSAVRVNYIKGMQALAELAARFARDYDQLANLYTGTGLNNTFVDGDFVDSELRHLDPALVATITNNLVTARNSMTAAILQSFARAVGKRIS